MPYTIKTIDDLKYVHLSYYGDVDLAQRQQAREDVFNLIHENNFHRTLVDLTASNILMSESDIIKFANSFKTLNIPDNYRLAGVINSDSHPDSTLEIIVSLDGINVKYFFDKDEAISWLTAV